MSKVTSSLHVNAPRAEVLQSSREALDRLGWDVLDEGPAFVLCREDITRLCCTESPAQARLDLEPDDAGGTIAELTVKVPGIGPIASRSARSCLTLVERVVRDPAGSR